MKKLIFTVVMLFSCFSFAEDLQLSKDEFLTRLMNDQLTMNKDPIFSLPEGEEKKKVMDNFRQKDPSFRDAYWFVPNVKTNKYLYTVFYQWPTRQCLYRSEQIEKDGKVKRENIDIKGTVIAIKYCEKAYGIKIN